MEFDVLIRDGLVFDGTGAEPVSADVALTGELIAEVGDLSSASAGRVVDAEGQAVAPGFIDAHTHSDLAWSLAAEHLDVATAAVRQGVTTEICGNCGFSPFPHLTERRRDMERHMGTLFGGTSVDWHDLSGFTSAAQAAGRRGDRSLSFRLREA